MITLRVSCPICGKTVSVAVSDNGGWAETYDALLQIGWCPEIDRHDRQTIPFCSEGCKEQYRKAKNK